MKLIWMVVMTALALLQGRDRIADPSTNRPALVNAGAPSQVDVYVVFSNGKTLHALQLRIMAMEALHAQGYWMQDSFHWFINASVRKRDPGCVVTFRDLSNRKFYEVEFDKDGKTSTRVGEERHGTPAPGTKTPMLLPNGVIQDRK